MREFVYSWNIQNISYSWHQTGIPIPSPKFFAFPFLNTEWVLELYPRGIDNCDYFSLKLCRMADGVPQDLSFNIEFSCLSAEAEVLHSSFIPLHVTKFTNNGFSGYAEECFIQRQEVFGQKKAIYLPYDVLMLRCRMWMDGGISSESISNQNVVHTFLETKRIILSDVIELEDSVEKSFSVQSKRRNNKTLMAISLIRYGEVIDVGIIPVTEEVMKYSTCKVSLTNAKTKRKLYEHIRYFVGFPKKTEWRLPFVDRVISAERNKYEFIAEIVYATGDTYIVKEIRPNKIPEFLAKYIISCGPSGRLNDFTSLSKDLWKLYAEKVLCDVELKTPNKSFFAHQFVLCSRSSVFLTMLTWDMKEKSDNCIEIEDISAESLEEFLKFLYTNSFTDFRWNTLMELYYAADKYNVEGLILLCCLHLLKNVNDKNIYELLFLAERHQDLELKRKVSDFIWKNDEKVFSSSKWKNISKEQPQLAIEIMLSKYENKAEEIPFGTYEEAMSHIPKIQDEFKSFSLSKLLIVIKTAGNEFPVHKTVLCASSSTIKEMFTNDLSDKSIKFIEMKDLEDNIVSQMITFLYTNSLPDAKWDIVVKLYHAANMYQIHRLKYECSVFLLENLRMSNVCNLLLLVHEHHDVKLKSALEDFIFLYHEHVFGSDEWTKLIETNPLLALETMQAKYRKK